MLWNTTTEDNQMERIVDSPHDLVHKLVALDEKGGIDSIGIPTSRRGWLDLLQVKVMAFPDRYEVGAVFEIKPVDCQPFCSDSCPASSFLSIHEETP